jgi:H+/Cl- antiporter ClcA
MIEMSSAALDLYSIRAVFTSAARAPLTSLASVVEMTGDFSLTLPVMLAVAVGHGMPARWLRWCGWVRIAVPC